MCPLLALILCGSQFVYGEELRATITTAAGQPLADAVVIAIAIDPDHQPTLTPATAIEDQVEKQFVPYVNPVLVGTSVSFPNSDKIRHQVYSFSPAKRFELPLYAGSPAAPVVFDKPGPVALGCNIHDWMRGYIYVAESPWFAQSDAAGRASVSEMPAGRYRVRVWHPQMRATEDSTAQEITVTADASAAIEWQIDLKPAILRRAPIGSEGGYR
ncbi:MAG: hypothetical protein ACREXT_09705 [Gammaproteobacteria bacterium]